MDDAAKLILGFVAGAGIFGVALVYLLLMPEKAEKVGGWLSGLVAGIWKSADKKAVALKVQGAINSMRAEQIKHAPDLIEKKLKISFTDVDEAEARLKDGECLVVMKRSDHHEANLAHALMAFLPKALLTRARPYLDKERMRAADLVIAKSLLSHSESPSGVLPAFYEAHLDPARSESVELKRKIRELDDLDLQGWLSRVLLAEYRELGDALHPGEPDPICVKDAEAFAQWLHGLAQRTPGDETKSLNYKGRYFRVAVIFVATKERLATEGLAPYRKRAKRYLYQEKYDAIYLMARDANIPAVQALVRNLERDARVARTSSFRYPLRADFKKRKMNRDEAIVVCLRRRQSPGESQDLEDLDKAEDLPEDTYEPSYETAELPAQAATRPGGGSAGAPDRCA